MTSGLWRSVGAKNWDQTRSKASWILRVLDYASIGQVFLFPYIALISAIAAQMALLGFIFFLSLSLPECVTLWSRIIPMHVRERERGKKKEEEKSPRKKPLRRDRDLNPQTLSPEPSVPSIGPRHPAQHSRLKVLVTEVFFPTSQTAYLFLT